MRKIKSSFKQWSKAYPLDIFPEPDFKKAASVLKQHGMTLDSISASNMRHVLEGLRDEFEALEALREAAVAVVEGAGEVVEYNKKYRVYEVDEARIAKVGTAETVAHALGRICRTVFKNGLFVIATS